MLKTENVCSLVLDHFTSEASYGPIYHAPNYLLNYVCNRCNIWTLGDHLASMWHVWSNFNLSCNVSLKKVPDSMSQLACSWLLVQNKHIMGNKCHYLISGCHVIVFLIISNPPQVSLDIWQKMVPCSMWSQLACSQTFVQITYFTHTKDEHLVII